MFVAYNEAEQVYYNTTVLPKSYKASNETVRMLLVPAVRSTFHPYRNLSRLYKMKKKPYNNREEVYNSLKKNELWTKNMKLEETWLDKYTALKAKFIQMRHLG